MSSRAAVDRSTAIGIRSGATGITVRDLVQLPHLRTTVFSGGAGLDREVSWAHVTEDEAPWNWLDPGDLVLTSGAIVPQAPAAQAEFVEAMARAGLSGIVIGEGEARPSLTDRMHEAAERLGFPVLTSEYGMSFVQYIRIVAAANQRGENRSLSQIVRVHDEVLVSIMEQRSSQALIEGLVRVLGCPLFVVDPELWEHLLPDCEVPDPAWQAARDEAVLKRGGKAPLVVHLHVADQLGLAMPIPVERQACLLVLPEAEPAPRLAVLQQVATACALEIRRVDAGFERDRRSGAALLNEALQGRLDAKTVDSTLADRGLDTPRVGIAFEGSPRSIDRLAHRWAVRGVPLLLGEMGPTYIGVIQSDDSLLDELAQRTISEQWRAGASDPFYGADGLSDAIRQARWALETIRPGSSRMSRYGDEGGDGFLPRTLAESQLAANRILGPLVEYDREHSTELIKTLQTYLNCDRSPRRAAEHLFVHTQTVNYRIGRVQELTGRSMRSTGDVSELWFALRALALSGTAV